MNIDMSTPKTKTIDSFSTVNDTFSQEGLGQNNLHILVKRVLESLKKVFFSLSERLFKTL
jgi:hypothetical protein